jgi:hypothetical protein
LEISIPNEKSIMATLKKTADYFIQATVNGQEKGIYTHLDIIGNEENYQKPIFRGDTVKLKVVKRQIDQQGTIIYIDAGEAGWKNNLDATSANQVFYERSITGEEPPQNGFFKVVATINGQQIVVDLNIPKYTFNAQSVPNNIIPCHFPSGMTTSDQDKYRRLINSVTPPALGGLCSGITLQEKSSFSNSNGGVEHGLAKVRYQTTDAYQSLHIENPIIDNGIIKNATVVRRFTDIETEIFLEMLMDEQEHELLTYWIDRISATTNHADWVETLKHGKENRGQGISESFINSLCYEITPEEIGYYLFIGNGNEIYLNYQEDPEDNRFLGTLVHEIAHIQYRVDHTFDFMKWLIIREKQSEHNYQLGDEFGKNGHCSTGPGHEMYNPENEYVCEE